MVNKDLFLAVPVVVIFTKCEVLEVTGVSALQQEGYSFEQAMVKAPKYAQDILNTVRREVRGTRYPPQAHVDFRGELFLCEY